MKILQNPEIGLNDKEVKQYSLLRAINAHARGNWDNAGFELECSRTIQDDLDRVPRGFFVPFEIQRTLTVGGALTGAEMVGTDHLAGSFIDALIAESVSAKLGVTFLAGMVGDVDVPALGAATFYWLAEDADVTDSTPASRSMLLSPKTVAGSVPMSRRFLKQSSPSAEAVVQRLLVRGAAAAIDTALFNGSGAAGQPTGITNISGVTTETITTPGQPTWVDLIAFESAVEADVALTGKLSYVVTPAVKGHCKATPKDSGGAAGFLYQDNEINGYQAISTSLLTANDIIFGNFEDAYVGMWGVLDVMPDVAAKAAAGGLTLRVFQDVDVNVGNAVSFCINA